MTGTHRWRTGSKYQKGMLNYGSGDRWGLERPKMRWIIEE